MLARTLVLAACLLTAATPAWADCSFENRRGDVATVLTDNGVVSIKGAKGERYVCNTKGTAQISSKPQIAECILKGEVMVFIESSDPKSHENNLMVFDKQMWWGKCD